MREAVTEIANVVTTMGAKDFEEARLVRFGVERLVIILGEAAALRLRRNSGRRR